MTKKLLLLLSLTIILISTSCQKEQTFNYFQENGVNTIQNNGTPANPNLNITVEKIQEIKGFNETTNNIDNSFYNVSDYTISDEDDLFIFDSSELYIYKYSKDGSFIRRFAGKGSGPGEFSFDKRIHFNNKNHLYSISFIRANSYTNNGDFIKNYQYEYKGIPERVETVGNDIFVRAMLVERRGDDIMNDSYRCSVVYKTDTLLTSRQFLPERVETSFADCKDHSELFLNEICLASSNSSIFTSTRSKDKYIINEYDTNFNLIKKISMNYIPKPYSVNELKYVKDNFVKDSDFATVHISIWKDLFDKKISINDLFFDKQNGYLLVENAPDYDNQSVKFDVFKDGIYQNSFAFKLPDSDYRPMPQTTIFNVKNGKLYYYSEETNSINIYKISYL